MVRGQKELCREYGVFLNKQMLGIIGYRHHGFLDINLLPLLCAQSCSRCQMSDYRSTEASTLMLKSLRKDFMPNGLFLVRICRPRADGDEGMSVELCSLFKPVQCSISSVSKAFQLKRQIHLSSLPLPWSCLSTISIWCVIDKPVNSHR